MRVVQSIEAMTIPKGFSAGAMKLSDMVRSMAPFLRVNLTASETQIGIYLRGNSDLFEGLKGLIESRRQGRANLPVPSNPVDCKVSMAMDRELRWLLSRLEFIHKSPAAQPAEKDSEQPA